MTSSRFGTEDLHRVLERLSKCEFLGGFEKIGRARYGRNAQDGIRHGVELNIERTHGIALVVTPILFIDHKQARQVLDAGIGARRPSEAGLVGVSLWDISKGTLYDSDGGEYGLVPSAVKDVLNEQGLFKQGFWRPMDGLEDLAQRIDADLKSSGTPLFGACDTLPKLVEWLKSNPSAAGTASRIILLCLYYVQGQNEEILRVVSAWAPNTASPMELRFAKYIVDRIRG